MQGLQNTMKQLENRLSRGRNANTSRVESGSLTNTVIIPKQNTAYSEHQPEYQTGTFNNIEE